jgi:thymidylate synthase ThyX
MHTLARTELSNDNFEYPIDENYLKVLNELRVRTLNKEAEIQDLKNALPDGFLQRRIWVMNYKCLQNIYIQRHDHRLPQWRFFCDEILKQLDHPEFIVNPNEKE